ARGAAPDARPSPVLRPDVPFGRAGRGSQGGGASHAAGAQALVDRGAAVIGLEPACLLSFRDEFCTMLPGSEVLARHAFLFEEFIARELDAGHFSASFAPLAKKALLHGHCHQKAFDAMPAVMRVLKLIRELRIEAVESSCCGMAGSFGYEAEHYAVSMKMAELSLLPAVRNSKDALVVADGTS